MNLTQNEYEFYGQDAESVQVITSNNGSLYHGRARAVQGGTVVFFPAVKIEDLK